MGLQEWEHATLLYRTALEEGMAVAHTAPVHAYLTSFHVVTNDTSLFAVSTSPNLSFRHPNGYCSSDLLV
jgi:hypothetical protein